MYEVSRTFTERFSGTQTLTIHNSIDSNKKKIRIKENLIAQAVTFQTGPYLLSKTRNRNLSISGHFTKWQQTPKLDKRDSFRPIAPLFQSPKHVKPTILPILEKFSLAFPVTSVNQMLNNICLLPPQEKNDQNAYQAPFDYRSKIKKSKKKNGNNQLKHDCQINNLFGLNGISIKPIPQIEFKIQKLERRLKSNSLIKCKTNNQSSPHKLKLFTQIKKISIDDSIKREGINNNNSNEVEYKTTKFYKGSKNDPPHTVPKEFSTERNLLISKQNIENEQNVKIPIKKLKKLKKQSKKLTKSSISEYREEEIIIKPKPRPVFATPEFYLFTIANGNNSQLVRRCMERRFDSWKEVPSNNFMFHFKWMPVSKGLHYEQLSYFQRQLVNHFEYHTEITAKDCLFKSLLSYAELNKINIFDYVPLTFILDVDSHTYGPDFEKFTQCYDAIESVMKSIDQSANDYKDQCIKGINKKLSQLCFSKDRRVITHCKPKISKAHFAGRNIWILKPTEFNRGQGVSVFDSMEKLKALIEYFSEGGLESGPTQSSTNQNKSDYDSNINKYQNIIKSRTFVIQKYIEKPLLIHDRKFDIRVWVLVSHDMKVYFFKEGYIRTSSFTYSMDKDEINNRNIHLTNNAVQKFTENYGAFEDGNQLSFQQFQEYLNQKYPDKQIDVNKNLKIQMKDLIIISMQSVRKKLNADDRNYCFEIFGYDFIIDEEFKAWIIEINTNPCIEESSALLKTLLPRMIDDALKLTLDQIFPRKKKIDPAQEISPYNVPLYSDYENMWEYLCQIGLVKTVLNSKTKTINKITENCFSEENKVGEEAIIEQG